MMGREIKFRAWEVNKSRFTYLEEAFENLMNIFNGKLVCNSDEEPSSNEELEYYKDGSYVLQQYTGLKDNTKWEDRSEIYKDVPEHEWDGIKIYDGDILKITNCNDYNGEESVTVDYIKYFNNEMCFRLSKKPEFNFFRFADNFKVIGNIYENPELLKEES